MRLIAACLTAACATTAATASAEEAAADRDAIIPLTTHTAFRASAGPSARMLFDFYVVGGEAEVGAGLDSKAGSYGLTLSFFSGVIEGGLFVLDGTAAFEMGWPIGRVRLGVAPRVGYLGMSRITSERQFGAYTFGLAGRASYDVLRDRGNALALGLQPTVDVAAALGNDGQGADGAAPFWGARAFFEWRYRSAI